MHGNHDDACSCWCGLNAEFELDESLNRSFLRVSIYIDPHPQIKLSFVVMSKSSNNSSSSKWNSSNFRSWLLVNDSSRWAWSLKKHPTYSTRLEGNYCSNVERTSPSDWLGVDRRTLFHRWISDFFGLNGTKSWDDFNRRRSWQFWKWVLSTKSLRSMKVSLLPGGLRGVLNHQPKPPIKHLGEKVCGISCFFGSAHAFSHACLMAMQNAKKSLTQFWWKRCFPCGRFSVFFFLPPLPCQSQHPRCRLHVFVVKIGKYFFPKISQLPVQTTPSWLMDAMNP